MPKSGRKRKMHTSAYHRKWIKIAYKHFYKTSSAISKDFFKANNKARATIIAGTDSLLAVEHWFLCMIPNEKCCVHSRWFTTKWISNFNSNSFTSHSQVKNRQNEQNAKEEIEWKKKNWRKKVKLFPALLMGVFFPATIFGCAKRCLQMPFQCSSIY